MKLISLNISVLLIVMMGILSCDNSVISNKGNFNKDVEDIIIDLDSSEFEEERIWIIDGQKVTKVSRSLRINGNLISLFEFPKELLTNKDSEGSDRNNSGKILLCEIKPDKKLSYYAKQHKMSDDELMMYLSFEIQNRFSIYNDSLKEAYSPDGLIYEPSHGVSENEKFLLFFNDDKLFNNSYSIFYDDEFFGIGLTEFKFKETQYSLYD